MALARKLLQYAVYFGGVLWIRSLVLRLLAKGKDLPGPKGVPLLGNIFDLPENFQWFLFTKWRKIYGDVIGLSALGTNIIVINSRKAVEDLLVDRSSIYSDRPELTLMKKFLGFDWSSALLPYEPELLRQRKMMAQCLGPAHHKKYYHDIRVSVHEMCTQIVEKPEDWSDACKLMIIKNIIRVAYGFNVKDFTDNYVVMVESLLQATRDIGSMGTHPIDVFPSLAIFPEWIWGRKFAKNARQMRYFSSQGFHLPWKRANENLVQGTLHPNSMAELLTTSYSESTGLSPENEYSIKSILGMAYSAGVDTTLSTLRSFVLAMITHPSTFAKAQGLVDEVLAGERLPDYTDRDDPRLVYIEAVLMEVFRWGVVLPLALPHRLMEDDVYNGMLLKKGATILPNTWACLRDPEDYPDPDTFNPERFLEPVPGSPNKFRLRKDVPDPRGMAFGYGRRVCPGRHFADSILWVAVTSMLCIFDIAKQPDPSRPGQFIEPDLDFDSSIAVSSPKPFQCIIKPRSEAAKELLRVSMEK